MSRVKHLKADKACTNNTNLTFIRIIQGRFQAQAIFQAGQGEDVVVAILTKVRYYRAGSGADNQSIVINPVVLTQVAHSNELFTAVNGDHFSFQAQVKA